ncbi:MAG TPA: hypothetical protein VII12_16465 [Thermoanaerobaculia bacterium]
MSLELQPSTASQLEDIAGLLCEAFNAPSNAAFVDHRLLRWKYFDSAEVWGRPCSYVLTQMEALAAHCAVAPLDLLVPVGPAINRVPGVCFMDWASARQAPYAGLLLKKRLMRTTGVAIVTGGTALTRALIPKLGFAIHTSVDTFARVIRPLRQWRTRPRTSRWKDAARLLRNTMWSFAPLSTLSPEWTAIRVENFAEETHTSLTDVTIPEHGVELLNYWLRCPTVAVNGYEIRRRGVLCGHFLLTQIGGQTRIADLRLTSAESVDWQMAYRLAAEIAAQDDATCEVVALASTPLGRQALSGCGFRRRGSTPLSIYDPQRNLTSAPPLFWSYMDNDAGYLYDPASPYCT